MLVALTVGLVFWLIAWSLGVKSFDAFMVTILLTVIAASVRAIMPFMNRILKP